MKLRSHLSLLYELLSRLPEPEIKTVLDAGSGRTSLSALMCSFPDADVTAVIYPGDERKRESCSEFIGVSASLCEADLCSGEVKGPFDLTVAHLLLGECRKFGHEFSELLSALRAIDTKYLAVIDYSEDPVVCEKEVAALSENGFELLFNETDENPDPQDFGSFKGVHNFGYLFRKN